MASHACLNALMFMLLLSFACVAHSALQNCVYTVYVKTTDVAYAGTDAKVNLKLYDNQGNMVEIADLELFGVMPQGRDYFERNNLDVFAIRTKCLATKVCKMELSHDNTGVHPSWSVDYLEVNTAAPQMLCNHQNFGIQDWLSTKPPHQLSVVRDACGPVKESVLEIPDFNLLEGYNLGKTVI